MSFACFDFVTVGVCIIDKSFTIIWWNSRLEEWTGKKREEVIGARLSDLFPHFQEEKYKQRIRSLFVGGPPVVLSSQLHRDLFFARTVTGEPSIQQATVSAFPAENDGYYALFSIEDITDVSRRIMQYREMRDKANKASEEKEILFREMNHRIKNNLNMVSALIELQISKKNKETQFENLKNQINAIKIVHEQLYKDNDLSGVRLKRYLGDIVNAVIPFSGKNTIQVHIDVPDIIIEPNKLIPLGLICNEVATNTVKHGFQGDETHSEFSLLLRIDKKEKKYILKLAHNGKPFPPDIGLDRPDTFGLRLITALIEQLEGTIELQRSPSPEYTIRFPTSPE